MSLSDTGERTPKRRLTHDDSFSFKDGLGSVNDRVNIEEYPEMIYGQCFSRLIHYVVALRLKHPNRLILVAKFDYSDAYRRVTHNGRTAAQQILVVEETAYIMLRMTFGGSANPPCLCSMSEMTTDLSNELFMAESWDHTKVNSPIADSLEPPRYNSPSAHVTRARPMVFDIPTSSAARTDSFIDDLICVCLDDKTSLERAGRATPLAVHVTSRPHAGPQEPIKHRLLLGPDKLKAEGAHAEVQVVLGWQVDCKALKVYLPKDKYMAWTGDVDTVALERKTDAKTLASLIGRLNHAAAILPLSRHFLDRLRKRLDRTPNRCTTTLSRAEVEDLILWKDFLKWASEGVSMNLLVHRRPDALGVSDSCPYGLGGFTLDGRAWRIHIPRDSPIYGDDRANNLLEFLGMAVNVWLLCRTASPDDCLLVLGDNTSAIGWLFKAGRLKQDSFYYKPALMIARKVARVVMRANVCLSTQHLRGKHNWVADWLSFSSQDGAQNPMASDDPDNSVLTDRFHSGLPQLIPERFKISQLFREVLSWTVCILQTLEFCLTQETKGQTRSMTETGRWRSFTNGLQLNESEVSQLPDEEREAVTKAFLESVRTAQFDHAGRVVGRCDA